MLTSALPWKRYLAEYKNKKIESHLHNLMWDGGEETYNDSFVGYLPEGKLPASDLEEMLDWNKILRSQVITPAQLEDYRTKYIRKT